MQKSNTNGYYFFISNLEDGCKNTKNVAEKCEISKAIVKDKGNVKGR